MNSKSIFGRLGRSSLRSADTHKNKTDAAHSKEGKTSSRISHLFNKAKGAIKRKCSRVGSSCLFSRSNSKVENALPDSGYSSHTAIDGAFEPENTQDAACRQASYCTAIERLTKGLLEAESVCAIKTECGAFWRTKNAHVARIEMIEWLYKISTPSYLDCRAFHLSIQYLDQFLNDIVQPIENGHLKNYALACFFLAKAVIEGSPHIKVALPDSEKYLPETSEFKQALTRVVQNLDWCLNLVHGAAGKTFVKTIDMPTIADFLLLSFQRAAIELPERFADKALIGAHKQRHGQDQVDLGDDVQAVLPRQFAIGPFAKACRLASNILRDEYSLLFRSSELAAACFLIAAELEGIDRDVFIRCTGYTPDSVQAALAYARGV